MTFTDSSLPPVLPEDVAAPVAAVAGSVLLPTMCTRSTW
jgi:hypothetical protein